MRTVALIALLAACTRIDEVKTARVLQTAGHRHGFEIDGSRVDPSTLLHFKDVKGRWSAGVRASELRVDAAGAWLAAEGAPQPIVKGWRWDEMASVEIETLDGADTAEVFLLASVFAPLAGGLSLAARAAPNDRVASLHFEGGQAAASDRPITMRIETSHHDGTWELAPAPASSLAARPLFTSRANREAWLRGVLEVDGGAGRQLGRTSSQLGGTVATVRLFDLLEIGGAVHAIRMTDTAHTSWVPAFHAGARFPLGAEHHAALEVPLELGYGGEVRQLVRLPFALQLSPASERWFVSLQPFAPAWMTTGDQHMAFSYSVGAGFGVAL